jgi:galactose mutarotase-like enzyme
LSAPRCGPGGNYGELTLTDAVGELEATFLTSLGMVVSSLRHRGVELLAGRGGPQAYALKGSTFGIPLLHPWANRLSGWEYTVGGIQVKLDPASAVIHRDAATGLPSHGLLAASRDWRVLDHDRATVLAELDFGARPELIAAFPFPHRLSYGFHPYISLPDAPRTDWELELTVRRHALLSDRGIPTGESVELEAGALDGPLGDRAFDDSFDELTGEPPTLAVADGRRRVAVSFDAGFAVAQVYSPGGSDFICLEPMTAPVDALRSGRGLRLASPGEQFTAAFTTSVRPLGADW